jgi:hypothetical protein
MKSNLTKTISRIGLVALFATLPILAQDHKWAGRTLNEMEWTIHQKLVMLPSYGIFDTLNIDVQGKTVTLSGQVISESVRRSAERVVRQMDSVDHVVNKIEVLPESKRDDALRMNVYRAIYEKQPLEKYGTRAMPPIHIVVKDGWVSLEGVVDSEADRGAAHLRALKVTPHVTDNLRVAPEV